MPSGVRLVSHGEGDGTMYRLEGAVVVTVVLLSSSSPVSPDSPELMSDQITSHSLSGNLHSETDIRSDVML